MRSKIQPQLQRLLALMRRHPRQAAAVTVAIAAAFFILLDPAPQTLARPPAPPVAQVPAATDTTQTPAPAPEVAQVDLMLFPEPAGVRVENFAVSRVEADFLRGAHWVLHVADPTNPATLIWEHTLAKPAQSLSVGMWVCLYTPRTTMGATVLDPIMSYAPSVEIIADGQIVRPLATALWAEDDLVLVTLQLPHPATQIKARLLLPPRLQAGYPAVTNLKLEGW